MKQTDALIILPHLNIQNVNTISSPLTWGFPSMTAVLGFTHALERKLNSQYNDLKFSGVGVICHHFEAQTYQAAKYSDRLFCLTRNPLKKDGNTASLNEEGRAHVEISLVFQATGSACIASENKQMQILETINNIVQTLRLAGGSIFSIKPERNIESKFINWPDYDNEVQKKESKKILRKLLPGFALVDRSDLLINHTEKLQKKNSEPTALDTLLEFSSIQHEPSTYDLKEERAEWTINKKPGWIVPIPIGYQAISELYPAGKVKNARDMNYPFQFVESIYSLGQWVSPHRLEDIHDIFWSYDLSLY
jgi:CRISPR-associated protein Csy2